MRICVIGIGYVGLPLAIRFAQEGFSVTGVDINKRIIGELNASRSTVEGVSDEQLGAVVQGSRTLNLLAVEPEPNDNSPEVLGALAGVDVFVICVQTPLHKDRRWEPETRWIQKAAQLICRVGDVEEQNSSLPRERLIVLESTTYPGTTRKILSAVCERFSQKGTLCHLAYSPERISPGPAASGGNNTAPGTSDAFLITRIVGGMNKVSCDTVRALYQTIFKRVHPVENPEAAELAKLIENTFRFISSGFANEMARVARSYGLNIWDILEAAKTKGFGLDMCFPGLIRGTAFPSTRITLGGLTASCFSDATERWYEK